MEKSLFLSCVRRLHRLQALYLTFYPQTGTIPGLKELLAVKRSTQSVHMQEGDELNLTGVAESGRWEGVSKTVAVYGLDHVSEDSLGRIAASLESVAAGDHFAKALFTSSSHKQLAATTTIIMAVLTGPIINEINDWGLSLHGERLDIEGLPAIKFTINKNGNLPVFRICVDGFSGRMQINGKWGDERCTRAEQLQAHIQEGLAAYLEKATVVA